MDTNTIPSRFKFEHVMDKNFIYTADKVADIRHVYAVMWMDGKDEMACTLYSVEEVTRFIDEGLWSITEVIDE